MKVRVTMKAPDTLHDAISDALRDLSIPGVSKAEKEE